MVPGSYYRDGILLVLEVAVEDDAMPIHVANAELTRAPGRVAQLRPPVKYAHSLVLLEQRIRVHNNESKCGRAHGPLLKLGLMLPLQVQLHVIAPDPSVPRSAVSTRQRRSGAIAEDKAKPRRSV